MMFCCVCGEKSFRREVCQECAEILWPHRIVNAGARQLARTLLPVPEPPMRHAASVLAR